MVMNYEIFDVNLHMINHYRRINTAKSVVNNSPPKSYVLRQKNTTAANTSRYSTPSLLSKNEHCTPSRPNSNCDIRRRKQQKIPTTRSSSVPPRPYSRRNPKTWPQNFLTTSNPFPKIRDGESKIKIPLKVNKIDCSHKQNTEALAASFPFKLNPAKLPIPTPRTSLSKVSEYEYLQFSLRITEDILRNDLYTPNEMQRVFNSHLEANRGRLNMQKMLAQIKLLSKKLNLPKNTQQSNKSKLLLEKLANQEYELTAEEIRNFSGTDLQDIITGILDYENEKKDTPNNNNIENLFDNTINNQSEISFQTSSIENPVSDEIPTKIENITIEIVQQIWDIPENIKSTSEVPSEPQQQVETENEDFLVSQHLIETINDDNNNKSGDETLEISQHPENNQIETVNVVTNNNNKLENENFEVSQLFETNQIETTNVVNNNDDDDDENKPENENFEVSQLPENNQIETINVVTNNNNKLENENFEVPQHPENDPINNNNNKKPESKNETLVSSINDPKPLQISDISYKVNLLHKDIDSILKKTEILTGIGKNLYELKSPKETFKNNQETLVESEGNISIISGDSLLFESLTDLKPIIDMNENTTQTPFSKEIAQFIETLPEKPQMPINHKLVQTMQEASSTSSKTTAQPKINFVTTVNRMITNQMNDLFKPLTPITHDYYKYELKPEKNPNPYLTYDTTCNILKKKRSNDSDLSLSEGEISACTSSKSIPLPRPNVNKSEPEILKQLKKYEHQNKYYSETNTINKYKLNVFESFTIPKPHDSDDLRYSTCINDPQVNKKISNELLSDGEIRCSSDSEGWRTDTSEDISNII